MRAQTAKNILPEMSNSDSHPGRAGGSPWGNRLRKNSESGVVQKCCFRVTLDLAKAAPAKGFCASQRWEASTTDQSSQLGQQAHDLAGHMIDDWPTQGGHAGTESVDSAITGLL